MEKKLYYSQIKLNTTEEFFGFRKMPYCADQYVFQHATRHPRKIPGIVKNKEGT